MLPQSLRAAATLAGEGIEAEVIDLRTLSPWDHDTVLSSVRRTRRLVVAHEAWVNAGFGAEIVATVAEDAATHLVAPVKRVGALPVPIPSGYLRPLVLPNVARIAEAIRQVMEGGPDEQS
jgi:pyruvate/2-oxoglutarate/acetoin dehydrogenase E1 component